MQDLSWENLRFEYSSNFIDNFTLSNENTNNIKKALCTIGTALLILGGLLIVSITAVALYTTYTSDKQIQSAIQMAKEQNRQIDLYTSNRYTMTVNVSNSSSLGIAGDSATINRVTVYPKNYYGERIILPSGIIITPTSL